MGECGGQKSQPKFSDNPMRYVRLLENKLDKAMIKYNESVSIRKTYEIILKRLREERISYDMQLSEMERIIKEKSGDFN